MSANPYSPPGEAAAAARSAREMVAVPAVALIVVSLFCVIVVLVTLMLNVYLLLSGTAERLPQPGSGITKEQQIVFRAAWEMVMLLANVVVLLGAVKMKRLQDYRLAKISAVLAMVPCIGPCCLLGIPFGLWAMGVLNRPEVVDAFARNSEDR